MTADIEDLKMEQWLRARNSGELKWKTKTGKEIPVKDMTDSHIENAIRYIEEIDRLNEMAIDFDPIWYKD